jgi:hypothetical protein
MDEIGFGPSGEARPPSRRLRALAAVSVAGVAVAGVAYGVMANKGDHPVTAQPQATQSALPQPSVTLPDPSRYLPRNGCKPTQQWPSLAGLPAGMHPGAVPVIVDAQFSGRCIARG